jgi:protocatechuate 3,4-dioxygenase beta subunit
MSERLISRREAIVGGAAAAGGAALYIALRGGPDNAGSTPTAATPTAGSAPTADSAASCILSPELTEGPYYLDNHLLRRDIREGKKGAVLDLELKVQHATTCKPIKGATVEIWHCDALGNYSGFPTGKTFLRGGQKTNAAGVATIRTIYPGWYRGRAVHIHVKVHAGGNVVHTGQLFFPDATSAKVYKRSPYSQKGPQDTPNSTDGIYGQGGNKSLVKLAKNASGYVGRVTMGVRA